MPRVCVRAFVETVSEHCHADILLSNRQHISTAPSNDPSLLFGGVLLRHRRQLDGITYPWA